MPKVIRCDKCCGVLPEPGHYMICPYIGGAGSNNIALPFVETKEILSHFNAKKFFAKYLPHIKRYEHKLRGYDTNNKPLTFSEDEKKQIIEAVQKFAKDIKK